MKRQHHVQPNYYQAAIKRTVQNAGIGKRVTSHVLRIHSPHTCSKVGWRSVRHRICRATRTSGPRNLSACDGQTRCR